MVNPKTRDDQKKIIPFFDDPIDDPLPLSIYDNQVPYFSWFDKMGALARENVPEQFARNILTEKTLAPRVFDKIGEFFGDPLKEVEPQHLSVEELNKKYSTDKFVVPMREDFAEEYLSNVATRERNEFIMNYDKPLGIMSQLAGGALSFFEPHNLATSLMMGPSLKGLSLLKTVGAIGAEAGVSSFIAREGQERGAGAKYTAEDLATDTLVGTVFGTGLHYAVQKFFPETSSPEPKKEETKQVPPNKPPEGDAPPPDNAKLGLEQDPKSLASELNAEKSNYQVIEVSPQGAAKIIVDNHDFPSKESEVLANVMIDAPNHIKTEVAAKLQSAVEGDVHVDINNIMSSVVPEKDPNVFNAFVESVPRQTETGERIFYSVEDSRAGSSAYSFSDDMGKLLEEGFLRAKRIKSLILKSTNSAGTPTSFVDFDSLRFKADIAIHETLSKAFSDFADHQNIKKFIKEINNSKLVDAFVLNGKVYAIDKAVIEKGSMLKVPRNVFKKDSKVDVEVKPSKVFDSGKGADLLKEAEKVILKDAKLTDLQASNDLLYKQVKESVELNKADKFAQEKLAVLEEADKVFAKEETVLKSALKCLWGGVK